jgi:hypothetical protein
MVHAGKTLYFASQMPPDSVLMASYTSREMVGLEGNEARCGATF